MASGSWVAEEAGALVCKTLCRHGIISRFSARPPLAQHAPDNFWSIAIPYTGLYWAGEDLPKTELSCLACTFEPVAVMLCCMHEPLQAALWPVRMHLHRAGLLLSVCMAICWAHKHLFRLHTCT